MVETALPGVGPGGAGLEGEGAGVVGGWCHGVVSALGAQSGAGGRGRVRWTWWPGTRASHGRGGAGGVGDVTGRDLQGEAVEDQP